MADKGRVQRLLIGARRLSFLEGIDCQC